MGRPEIGEKFKFNTGYIMLQAESMVREARTLYHEASGYQLQHIWVNSTIAPDEIEVLGIEIHEDMTLAPQEVWCSHLGNTE